MKRVEQLFGSIKEDHPLIYSGYMDADGTPGYRPGMASSSGIGYETVKGNTLMTASEFINVHATYEICSTQVLSTQMNSTGTITPLNKVRR